MLVHPDVQRAVRAYHPDLVIRWNEKSNRDTNRYVICQRIRSSRLVDERTALFEEYCYDYPVLWVDQATVADRRWFEALTANRWDADTRDIKDVVREESERKRKAISDMNRDWARDVGWWHWKKHAEQYSTAGMTIDHKSRRIQERLDRNGRDNLL